MNHCPRCNAPADIITMPTGEGIEGVYCLSCATGLVLERLREAVRV